MNHATRYEPCPHAPVVLPDGARGVVTERKMRAWFCAGYSVVMPDGSFRDLRPDELPRALVAMPVPPLGWGRDNSALAKSQAYQRREC